ncbi:unnamed protein product [Musa textilis]
MAAPNIEMIAASLRSCSLGGGGGGDHAGGITVELNSDTALPYHWEQCLDMRTGEIYYINRETGVRTTEDPRTAAASSSAYSSSYYRDGDGTSDEYSCSRVGSEEDDYEEEEEEDGGDTAASSTLSCTSPPESSANEEPGGQILVAAGCKACFMYFMVPKRVDACPKCGGGLLHLGRNGCV